MILDISVGDRFLFLAMSKRTVYSIDEDAEADPIVLRDENGKVVRIARLDFALLQANGGAVRTMKRGVPIRALTGSEMKGLYDPPKNVVLTEGQLKEWRTRRDDVRRAARILFYVQKFDASDYNKGKGLENFIAETHQEAKDEGYDGREAGFEKLPSPSSIRKALRVGLPNQRTFTSYLRKTGGGRNKNLFPQFVYDIGQKAVNEFYRRGPAFRYIDAHEWFDDRFFPARAEWEANASDVAAWEHWDRKPPTTETLSNWIKAARSQATLTEKFGARSASRNIRGRGRSLEPVAPLETIILDQTLAPLWCVEEVHLEGETRLVLKRPWIVWAIDLYSRMVLGFILTYDPPCIATLMACLRHVICPKTDWIERFGYCKGATDGFGAVPTAILDNAKAHIGRTMQMVGDVAGFRVVLAPIYTPEFKTWLERFNSTMNGSLRSLPGGIPLEDSEGAETVDAKAAANLSSDAVRKLMAHNIIKYHLKVHDGIGMAPARKWTEGLNEHGRITVDDARTYKLLLRRHDTAYLGPEGIYFKGHRFHDQGLTTMLLNDNARFHGSRKKPKPGQALRFKVHVFYDEMDVSSLTVINQHTKEVVELPNYDSFYAEKPVSFAFSAGERTYQARQNRDFHSRADQAAARVAYYNELEAEVATASRGVSTRAIRVLQGGEKPELRPGSTVIDVAVGATIDGRSKPQEIPISTAISDRVDILTAPKGRKPRGGGKSKREGPAIEIASAEPLEAVTVEEDQTEVIDASLDESEAMLDELARAYGFQTPSHITTTKQ